MKPNIILRLARKEFFGYINSALAYTVIVPFLLLSIFIYTRTALVGGEASLRPYFELLPWFLLLLAPALSMKLLTDEHKSETLEVLFAHPISELEIVLGKFFGALAFFIVILLTTIGLPLTLITYSRPDIGQIAGQYIGALLIGATFLSIGVAASAYVKNAISSFLVGAAISFVLIIIGLDFVTQMLPFPFSRIAAELSVLTHGENIARGLLDIRDVFYFVTITGLLLAAAITKLSERKTLENPAEKRKLHLAFGLIAAIGIISNVLLSYYPIRLDLTQSRLFTLSQGTKQTIRNLPDIVTITVYQSRELPAQIQLVARDITDLLKDYEKLSRNIKARVIYPEDSETATEAQSAGIQEVQFNSVGSGKFEVQAGVLGIAVRYGDKTESIPFVSDSSDLEYQLTRRIRKLTNDQGQAVGVLKTGFSQNQILDELLATQYETQTISADEAEDNLQDLKALVVVDDGSLESTASATIKNYLDQSGSVLYLGSGVTVDQRSLSAQKSSSSNDLFLKNYGVTLNNDLVYDLQLSETLAFGSQGGQRYLAQYPYWLRALPATDSFSPIATVKSISLGWPSSLTLDEKSEVTQKKLLVTGSNAGRTEGSFNISPQVAATLKPNAKEVLLAALVEKDNTRLVVVGSSTLADDQFLGNNRDNVAFLSNTIDYLATDKDLAIIPSKSAGRAVFEFKSPKDILFVQYGNLLIPPAVVIAFAVYHLRRRKNRAQRVYVK
jgi:ABC-type transport system involved in multi-copper enzyme maturation permease subunit/ABC-type uncharacterized transport system involved in gliding motility auxiliary subunit